MMEKQLVLLQQRQQDQGRLMPAKHPMNPDFIDDGVHGRMALQSQSNEQQQGATVTDNCTAERTTTAMSRGWQAVSHGSQIAGRQLSSKPQQAEQAAGVLLHPDQRGMPTTTKEPDGCPLGVHWNLFPVDPDPGRDQEQLPSTS